MAKNVCNYIVDRNLKHKRSRFSAFSFHFLGRQHSRRVSFSSMLLTSVQMNCVKERFVRVQCALARVVAGVLCQRTARTYTAFFKRKENEVNGKKEKK